MNTQVANIEHELKISLFSAMHGMFSVGGMVGAMVGSFCIAHDFSSEKSWILASIFILLISSIGDRYLLNDSCIYKASSDIPTKQSKSMLMPMIGALAFLGLVVEGAMYDWTSLFMRDVVNADTVWIGMGYAGFCIGMMIGRFSGDAIRKFLGDATLLQISGVIACSGFGVVLFTTASYFMVLGFLLIGLGNANFVPILFAAGARNHIDSAAKGIAYVSRIGYFGFLLGPVIIGFFTTQFNLQTAFLFVALCCFVITICAKRALLIR
jgi:fucose permease